MHKSLLGMIRMLPVASHIAVSSLPGRNLTDFAKQFAPSDSNDTEPTQNGKDSCPIGVAKFPTTISEHLGLIGRALYKF